MSAGGIARRSFVTDGHQREHAPAVAQAREAGARTAAFTAVPPRWHVGLGGLAAVGRLTGPGLTPLPTPAQQTG